MTLRDGNKNGLSNFQNGLNLNVATSDTPSDYVGQQIKGTALDNFVFLGLCERKL